MSNRVENKKFIKIVYFDDESAQDYLDIENGGHLDWSEKENKERIAKILAELEAEASGGFDILKYFRTLIAGKADASYSRDVSKIFAGKLESTMLTDFLEKSESDQEILKIYNEQVIAPINSASMYKMISSYLRIVPKEQLPIDIEQLNSAILDERGYYGLLLKSEASSPKKLLRFNIKCFKNNYNLADLAKMTLTFYGIKVGQCKSTELSIDKEFILQSSDTNTVSVDQIMNGQINEEKPDGEMEVIDVILAGVIRD